MDLNSFMEIYNNLDTKEQQEKFTELIAIYLHNSLAYVEKNLFLALKTNLPDGIYIEGGLGMLTIKDYPRSAEKSDKAMEIEGGFRLTLQTFYREIKSLDWQNPNLIEQIENIKNKYLNSNNLDRLDKAEIEGFTKGYSQVGEKFKKLRGDNDES